VKIYYNNQYNSDIEGKAKTSYIPGMTWEDIAQELDIVLWLGLSKYRGTNGAKERTFAQTIMRNRIVDLQKAAYRQKRQSNARSITFSELENTNGGVELLKSLGLYD
jgi:DNA-directed RNA polymerase specialized sigma24 family protein